MNVAFVEKFKLGTDAVGKYMGRGTNSDSLPIQIVGVVPNIKYNDVKQEAVFYLPWMQQGVIGQMYFYARSNLPSDQLLAAIPASFALLATLLAAVGLYGVLAYSVSQRTREIGVRMALGADSATVQRMVLRQVGVMIGIGVSIGALVAFGLGRAAQSMLFGLEGHDPAVFTLAVLLLAGVAFAAGWQPARRASRTEPMRALRYD